MRLGLYDRREYLLGNTGDDALQVLGVDVGTHHRKRLAGSSLSVREYSAIVAVDHIYKMLESEFAAVESRTFHDPILPV